MKIYTSFLRLPTMVVQILIGVLFFLGSPIVEACPYLNTIQRQNGGSLPHNVMPNPHLSVGEGQSSSPPLSSSSPGEVEKTRVDELRELLQPLREIELEYRRLSLEPEPVVNDIASMEL